MSPASASSQSARTSEPELQITSLTLYPHFFSAVSPLATTLCGCRIANSPCLSPFLSKKTRSCRSGFPAPPPGNPNLCVDAINAPLGLHAKACSSPGTASDVLCNSPLRSYTRNVRCDCDSGEDVGDREETTSNAPSPRQLIRGRPSSSGLEPTAIGVVGV
jgi:hypothetical protein